MSEPQVQPQILSEEEIKEKLEKIKKMLHEGKLDEIYSNLKVWEETIDQIIYILSKAWPNYLTIRANFDRGKVGLILPSGLSIELGYVNEGELKLTYDDIKRQIIQKIDVILEEFLKNISKEIYNLRLDIELVADYIRRLEDP